MQKDVGAAIPLRPWQNPSASQHPSASQPLSVVQGRVIRAVLFDLGDTLWTAGAPEIWERLERVGHARAFEILQRYFPDEPLLQNDAGHVGSRLGRAMNNCRHIYHLKHPGYEPDIVQNMLEALRSLGLPALEPEVCRELHETFAVPIAESRVLFPDVLGALATLKQWGYKLGVVTNRGHGGPAFLESVRVLGLLEYFEPAAIATSIDLGLLKPHPDIFWHTLNALEVRPEESIMVGDALRADVAGAHALHMFAAWIPKPRLRALARSYFVERGEEMDDERLYQFVVEEDARRWPDHAQVYPATRPDIVIERISDLLPLLQVP